MLKPFGKKGFYVSAPLVGVALFLIAVLIAAMIETENNANIGVARSSSHQDKLEFVAQTILADSYDVLLQQNLEVLTSDFLNKEYHWIDPNEPWEQSFRNSLARYYNEELGEALGLNLQAYRNAYSNIPGIEECKIERIEGAFGSRPSITDRGDGAIIVKGQSYGETVRCIASDPEGEVYVDIIGRYYRINVRAPELYDVAGWVLNWTTIALDRGIEGINEPIAIWEAPRWLAVDKVNNIPLDEEDKELLNTIIDSSEKPWVGEIDLLSKKMIAIANNHIRDSETGFGLDGIRLDELLIQKETEGDYDLNDFEISCVEDLSRQYRSCMPNRVLVTLGETLCSRGEPPKNTVGEFYSLEKRVDMDCGSSKCPPQMADVMGRILSPLGSVCVDYYANLDSVRPVCKKWEAKVKSALIKGVLKDDKEEYVVSGREDTDLKFKTIEPNVETYNVWKDRLRCDEGSTDEEVYKENVRILLERMKINLGMIRDPSPPHMTQWVDIGSSIQNIVDPDLSDIYRNVLEGTLPRPCFIVGAKGNSECNNPDKPRIELRIDWSEIRNNCIAEADNLCNALCGGKAVENFKTGFCNSIFTEGGHSIGQGTLSCEATAAGPNCQKDLTVSVKIASFHKKVG